MRIAMIGAGYVGLVSGACFAEFGFDVTCVDLDAAKIERLRRGEIPIYEPGLEQLVVANAESGRLTFSTDLPAVVGACNVVFIAVGTPTRRGDGHADLSYVDGAARQIAAAIKGYTVVVNKSTVPIGTGRRVERIIRETRPDAQFDVVSNPEFLREGSAVNDFMRPDRVVIGTESERARKVMRQLYRVLYLSETPMVETTLESAELAKYATNAFLATKVTFINEMADICDRIGGDVQTIAKVMGLDKRIGPKFLHAGPGYGGSCFPKDTLALVRMSEELQTPSRIVSAVVEANNARKLAMAERIVAAMEGRLEGKTIGVLGLAFKPNTDDMREAPSLTILPQLVEAGAIVKAYDPASMNEARPLLPGVAFCEDAASAVEGADAVVVLTEWNEFRALDVTMLRGAMKGNVVVDLRNIYDPEQMRELGFAYVGLGRGSEPTGLADRIAGAAE